jgi:hypothetical protein
MSTLRLAPLRSARVLVDASLPPARTCPDLPSTDAWLFMLVSVKGCYFRVLAKFHRGRVQWTSPLASKHDRKSPRMDYLYYDLLFDDRKEQGEKCGLLGEIERYMLRGKNMLRMAGTRNRIKQWW